MAFPAACIAGTDLTGELGGLCFGLGRVLNRQLKARGRRSPITNLVGHPFHSIGFYIQVDGRPLVLSTEMRLIPRRNKCQRAQNSI